MLATRHNPLARIPDKLRKEAMQAYVSGNGSATVIAHVIGVKPQVVKKWVKDGSWVELREFETQSLNFIIRRTMDVQTCISKVTTDMGNTTKPNEVVALAKALEMLLRCWQLLKGHPNPGTRKQPKEKPRSTEEL